MKFSKFGQKFTRKTGILQLMDDLGNALAGSEPVLMLGGGNPARLPEVHATYERGPPSKVWAIIPRRRAMPA